MHKLRHRLVALWFMTKCHCRDMGPFSQNLSHLYFPTIRLEKVQDYFDVRRYLPTMQLYLLNSRIGPSVFSCHIVHLYCTPRYQRSFSEASCNMDGTLNGNIKWWHIGGFWKRNLDKTLAKWPKIEIQQNICEFKCWLRMFVLAYIGATNLNSKGPTNFRS